MQFRASSLILVATAAAAAAVPVLQARAGGPIAQPIPADCDIYTVRPSPMDTAFKPTDDFIASAQIYSYYLPDPAPVNDDDAFQNCLEQCYGYGNPGRDCKSVVWAHQVPGASFGYGSGNGSACLFFHGTVYDFDLEATTDGTYVEARADNIVCPVE